MQFKETPKAFQVESCVNYDAILSGKNVHNCISFDQCSN